MLQIHPDAPTPDWDLLMLALEGGMPDATCFFDRVTGRVPWRSPHGDPDPELERALDEEPGRFVRIDPIPSRERFRWMQDFVEALADDALADDLARALRGSRPFRGFRDALHADARAQWFAEQERRLRRSAVAWLAANAVAVGAAPPWAHEDGSADAPVLA
jgi:hypothetical protein